MGKRFLRQVTGMILLVIFLTAVLGFPTIAAGTMGTLVLQEDFSTGSEGDNISGWNGWDEIVGNPSTLDSEFTIAKDPSATAPTNKVAKLYRNRKPDSNSSLYFITKNITVPASTDLMDVNFRIRRDSNANMFIFRLYHSVNKTAEFTFYLGRKEGFILNGGAEENITMDGMPAANTWHDIEVLFDFTNSQLILYMNGSYVGSSGFKNSGSAGNGLFAGMSASAITRMEIGTNRISAVASAASFYLDDLKVMAYQESEMAAFVGEKLKSLFPGIITRSHLNPAATQISLPSAAWGSTVTWQTKDPAVISSEGLVSHPVTGDIAEGTLTATITRSGSLTLVKDYTVRAAPQNVMVAEDFEGYGETTISGWNGWEANWGSTSSDVNVYDNVESVAAEAGTENRAGSIYRSSSDASSVNFFVSKKFGQTANTSSAPRGLSVGFRLKRLNSSSELFLVYLGKDVSNANMEPIYINFNDGKITCNGTSSFFSKGAATVNRWYNFEIYFDLVNDRYTLYADNRKISDPITPLRSNLTPTFITFGTSRHTAGAGAHFLFDDIEVKTLTADEMDLKTAADGIVLFDEDNDLYENVTLPVSLDGGISAGWSSGDNAVMDHNGTIQTREAGETVMTAAFTKNGETVIRSYQVMVGAQSPVEIVSLVKDSVRYNVRSDRMQGTSQLMIAAYHQNILTDVKMFPIISGVGSKTESLSGMNIPINSQLKAFIWDFEQLTPLTHRTKIASDAATIYMCGDSTMASYDFQAGQPQIKQQTGWGQVLGQYFHSDFIVVDNYAVPGRSSKTFTEYNSNGLKNKIKAGDYLIIQFGHNDQKESNPDVYAPLAEVAEPGVKTYEAYLTDLVQLAKDKGAIPILATSIHRRTFTDGVLTDSLGGYPQAMKALAGQLDVPVLDLHTKTGEWLSGLGEEECAQYFRISYDNSDYTHLTVAGAKKIAQLAVEEIQRLELPLADFVK